MKHRILILTNRVPFPLNDGGALAMYAMIEGFHKAGWDVFLFSMNTSRHYVAQEQLPSLFSDIRFETFDINTDIKLVPTLRNFLLSKKPNHAKRFYDASFDSRLKQIISEFEPSIVQLESVYLATYIPSIRANTAAPISIRLHNIEYEVWERLAHDTENSFRRYYLKDLAARIKRFEISAWNLADVLIPITDTDAAVAKEYTENKKIFTTPFGVDTSKIQMSERERWEGYHIGAMDWMPNAEAITWFLEEVWPQLHQQAPEFRFHFAGRNMPGSFEKYENEHVICHGEVPDAKEFIRDKKILIVPLRSGGGIRVKILEAMAAGKLIVCTAIGMQGISAVPGRDYLLADTAEDFVRQIKWAMENKSLAEQIARNAAALVSQQYDQEKIMQALIAGVESVINSNRGATV